MPTPTITPAWAPNQIFTVTNTDYLAIDVRISQLDAQNAQLLLTVPPGATVNVVRDPAAWSALGTEIRSPTTWVTTLTSLGSWELTVTPGGTATDPATIDVSTATAVGATGWLRFIIRTLANAPCTIEPVQGVSIDRVLAGPKILTKQVTIPGPTVHELDSVTIAATAQATFEANPAPAAALPALPALINTWTPEATNPTALPSFASTPTAAGANAMFTAPGAFSSSITLSFRFATAYDLAGSGTPSPDARNEDTLAIVITPVTHGMVLVLDRSGSMSGGLGTGGTGISKWEASVRAAHAWLDIFRSLRPGTNHKAAIITFQHDACSAAAAGPGQITIRKHPDLADPGNTMAALLSVGDVTQLNLGTEQTCTPIGDALVKGLDVIAASLAAGDKASMVLLTDGYENSGIVRLAGTPPNVFRDKFDSPFYASAKTYLTETDLTHRIFSIGVGQSVDQGLLNDLPGPGPTTAGSGYYRLATEDVRDILPTFGQMLGQVLTAEAVGPTAGIPDPGSSTTPPTPLPGALYFPNSTGEQRLSVLVPWPASNHNLRVAFRPQTAADTVSFTPVNSPPAVVHYFRREHHGLMTIDLAQATGTTPSTAAYWRVELVDSGNVQQPLNSDDVLCIVDLVTRAEVRFNKRSYLTGESIQLLCSIRTGGTNVTGATVGVDVAQPGEGLGTFLSTNAAAYQRVRREFPPQGADPDQGKAHMFNTLLRFKHIDGLPIVTPPLFNLHDDGLHGDGAAGDGDYANTFTDTLKEGTYTFRFRIEGTLPDGSRFSRLFIRSTWVGVRPDATATAVSWTPLTGLPAGQSGSVMRITPKSASDEWLGPFRGDVIRLHVSQGTLDGPLVDNLDGSYDQRVLFRRGEDPLVNIDVYGIPMRPSGPGLATKDCCSLWRAALRCSWRKFLALFGR